MDRQIVEFSRRASNAIGLSIQYIITGLFSRLLTIVVGAFFGINVYRIFEAEMGIELLSLTMAIIAAFGVEAVGFMATHRAVKSYEDGKQMFIPLLFVAVYLLVSIGALMFADVSLAYRFVSVGIVILIGINYALIGMESVERNQARAVRNEASHQQDVKKEAREFTREMKRAALANEQAVKMATIAQPITQSATIAQPIAQSANDNAMIERACILYTAHEDGRDLTPATARQALAGVSGRTVSNTIRYSLGKGHIEKKAHGVYAVNGNDPRNNLHRQQKRRIADN